MLIDKCVKYVWLTLTLCVTISCDFGQNYKFLENHSVSTDFYELSSAISRDDIEKIKRYLENGGDANLTSIGNFSSLLSIAAQENRLEIAKLLLEHKADPNFKEAKLTQGPLAESLKHSSDGFAMAKLLLSYKANPDPAQITNNFSRPFCKLLESYNKTESVDELAVLFIENGARIEDSCGYSMDNTNFEKMYKKELFKAAGLFLGKTKNKDLAHEQFRDQLAYAYSSQDGGIKLLSKYFKVLPAQYYDWAGEILLLGIRLKNIEIIQTFEGFRGQPGFFDKQYTGNLYYSMSAQETIDYNKQSWDKRVFEEIEQILIGFGMKKKQAPPQPPPKTPPPPPKSSPPPPKPPEKPKMDVTFGKKPADWDTKSDPARFGAKKHSVWSDEKIKKIEWWNPPIYYKPGTSAYYQPGGREGEEFCGKIKTAYSSFGKAGWLLSVDKAAENCGALNGQEYNFCYNVMQARFTLVAGCFGK